MSKRKRSIGRMVTESMKPRREVDKPTAPKDTPGLVVPVENIKDTIPTMRAPMSPYDIVRIPIALIDMDSPGAFWRSGLDGTTDHVVRKRFDGLINAGYKIHSFHLTNNGTMVFFLFEKAQG